MIVMSLFVKFLFQWVKVIVGRNVVVRDKVVGGRNVVVRDKVIMRNVCSRGGLRKKSIEYLTGLSLIRDRDSCHSESSEVSVFRVRDSERR